MRFVWNAACAVCLCTMPCAALRGTDCCVRFVWNASNEKKSLSPGLEPMTCCAGKDDRKLKDLSLTTIQYQGSRFSSLTNGWRGPVPRLFEVDFLRRRLGVLLALISSGRLPAVFLSGTSCDGCSFTVCHCVCCWSGAAASGI